MPSHTPIERKKNKIKENANIRPGRFESRDLSLDKQAERQPKAQAPTDFIVRDKQGENVKVTREEFNRIEDLKRVRTPTGSSQLDPKFVSPAIREGVESANLLNPPLDADENIIFPQTQRTEELQGELRTELIEAVRRESENLPLSDLQQDLLDEQGKLEIPESETRTQRLKDIFGLSGENLQEVFKSRVFQPFGISGFSSTAKLLENPEASLKRAGIETALGAGAGLALTTIAPSIVGTSIASARGVLTSKMGIANVLAGGFIIKELSGLNPDNVRDLILDREQTQEIQGAVNTVGQRAPTIAGTFRAGGISRPRALAEIRLLESDLAILEGKMKQAQIKSPEVQISGQYLDIIQDIRDQQEVIREAKADVLEGSQEFNEESIFLLLEELQRLSDEDRQKLTAGDKERLVTKGIPA